MKVTIIGLFTLHTVHFDLRLNIDSSHLWYEIDSEVPTCGHSRRCTIVGQKLKLILSFTKCLSYQQQNPDIQGKALYTTLYCPLCRTLVHNHTVIEPSDCDSIHKYLLDIEFQCLIGISTSTVLNLTFFEYAKS